MSRRNWFITGASSGLGKAMVEAVMATGDFVVATFRQADQVKAFNESQGRKARGLLLDITDMEQIDASIEKALAEFGSIDVLVNNAGIGFAGAIEEATLEEIRNVFEANFFGTVKLTQAVLPSMRAKKKGNIVQISSHAGVKAFAGFGIYNASKFALEGFSESLAEEVTALGIKVSIIEPGPFRTNFAGPSLRQAKKIIPAYEATAGAFRQKLVSVHNKQEGDPVKAAQSIIEHVNAADSTLRLPLGSIPLKTIGMKIESLKTDLELNRETALKVVF